MILILLLIYLHLEITCKAKGVILILGLVRVLLISDLQAVEFWNLL
jgi:hypothetical protein